MSFINVDSLLDVPEATIYWLPNWLNSGAADRLLESLITNTPWAQPVYNFHGNDVPMPRQVAWYGDEGASYGYSGVHHAPLALPPDVDALRNSLGYTVGYPFNSVLLNRYRTGKDSVAWHSDNEASLGPSPVIASVSLGATRVFALKPKGGGEMVKLDLQHGSLLVMMGATQENWVHQVPKTTKPVGERINLTFRRVMKKG